MQRVINFSGGKSSALMTILIYKHGDIVLFCDTGREHPKTYKFINDFEANENIPVIRTSFPGMFEGMIQKQGGKCVPNRVMRFCTKYLKIIAARKYLLSIDVTECENCIGFRADEQKRIVRSKSRWVKFHQRFPLNELNIKKEDVEAYWKQKKYTLEIPHILGNCDLCFMKGKNAILTIMRDYPELAEKWIRDEQLTGGTYFKDTSYSQLLSLATTQKISSDINKITPAYDCACTA